MSVSSPDRRSLVLCLVLAASACAPNGPIADPVVVPPTTAADTATSGTEPDPVGSADAATTTAPRATPARVPAGDVLVRPAVGSLRLPDVVGVVGDSLTVSAREEITAALALLGAEAVVDAQEGRRMTAGNGDLASGLTAIEEVGAHTEPDVWVVALGTNDVGARSGADRFRDDVRAVLAAVPSDAPLVWVDIWIRDRDDDATVANALLRTELGRRRAPTAVVDWHGRGQDDGVITADGVHLTETGRRAFADAIATQLVTLVAP